MKFKIGAPFRYGMVENFPPTIEKVDGMANWWWATRSSNPDLPSVQLSAGINVPATDGKDQPRIPFILLRSSTHKAGSAITPWEDIHRPDQGYSRYFGDNKVDSGKAAHEMLGNRRMLQAWELHVSGDRRSRTSAPPIMIFETFPYQGRAKGQLIFQGLAVLTRAELVVQQDVLTSKNFTNFRYDLVILDLSEDNDEVDWAWLDDRRNPLRSSEDVLKKAPSSWKKWVRDGSSALERLQRRVVKRHVLSEEVQQPLSGSEEAQILRNVYSFYEGRKHRFEVLADFVTAEVFRSQGLNYFPGWVTKGTGDGGVDFVARIDLDPDGAFPSSRQVVLGQAKCESLSSGTNGKDIARLAARLRRGWFGSYVTTSFFSRKVQEEVLIDRYPVLLTHGARVASVLRRHLKTNSMPLEEFLRSMDATYKDRVGHGDPEQVLL